ncbi:MAG TPA: ABC transporter permease subunit [Patescibacteria group bacterium]|nr:ABC transporter permease subunit [Patescibacteria group bacterium]
MFTLFKKEVLFYLNNPIGYIVSILFALFANFLFIKDLFLRGDSSMRNFFDMLPWLLIIFIPAISMRVFAEEKRTNTLELLLSLPISELSLVTAKFFGLVFFGSLSLALTFSLPVLLSMIGKPALSEILVSYSGSVLLLATFSSLSLFFSSVTKNQIIAFLFSTITLFFLILLGTDFFVTVIPHFMSEYISGLSPLNHYDSFLKGLVDIRSVFYFISFIILFIFMTVISVEKRD